jgi:hypothetical protein
MTISERSNNAKSVVKSSMSAEEIRRCVELIQLLHKMEVDSQRKKI